MDVLTQLFETILARRDSPEGQSYTAALFAQGRPHIARKYGEEAVELMVAALSGTKQDIVNESGDMLYHWLVLLAESGVTLEEVAAALRARRQQSGLEEKASRRPS